MKLLTGFGIGALFGLGLLLSGMTQPQKVIGFLDLNHWDPTLIFVMVGALVVHIPLAFFVRRQKRPVLDSKWHVPQAGRVDRRLLIGAAIFGIGWGLGGYCPGPALTSMASGRMDVVIFVMAMIDGMIVQDFFFSSSAQR